jgi:Cu/Ag efflux pump CusA
VTRYEQLELREPSTDRAELVRLGTREEIAPVLASALGIVCAMSPFVVLSDLAGYEIVHRMAVVVTCGLVTTTVFALFVVPSIYLHIGRRVELDMAEFLLAPAGPVSESSAPSASSNGGHVNTATTARRDGS